MDGVSASAANFNKASPTSHRQDQESGDFFARLMDNDAAARTSVARQRTSNTHTIRPANDTPAQADGGSYRQDSAETAAPTDYNALLLIQNTDTRLAGAASNTQNGASVSPSAALISPAAQATLSAEQAPKSLGSPETTRQSTAPSEQLTLDPLAPRKTAGEAQVQASSSLSADQAAKTLKAAQEGLTSPTSAAHTAATLKATVGDTPRATGNPSGAAGLSATSSGDAQTGQTGAPRINDSMSQYLSDQSKTAGSQNTTSASTGAATGASTSLAKGNSGEAAAVQPSGGQTPAPLPPAQSLNAPGDALSIMTDAAPDISATDSSNTQGGAPPSSAQAAMRHASPAVFQAWNNVIQRFDGKSQRFEIRLDPAELGEIDVTIDITEDNKAKVVLAARHPDTLAELTRGARTLELALSEAGIDMKEDGLTFELSQKEQNESSSFTFEDDHDPHADEDASAGSQSDAGNATEDVAAVQELTPQLSVWNRLHVNLRA